MNFYLVIFYLMNYFLITDRQTDRQKVMDKSSLYINTDALKNIVVSSDFMEISGVGW